MRHPLVLLFGMPRSGTTWIGKIFDSYPDTVYRHETDSSGRLNAVPLLAPADIYPQPEAGASAYGQTSREERSSIPS